MTKALLEEAGLLHIGVEESVVFELHGPAVVYAVMSSLTFDTLEALEQAMRTHGAKLTADFANFTDVKPQIQVNRVVSGYIETVKSAKKGST